MERIFSLTKDEAHKRGVCVNCKLPALDRCYSIAGRAEYQISGLCEQCFDDIMGGADSQCKNN